MKPYNKYLANTIHTYTYLFGKHAIHEAHINLQETYTHNHARRRKVRS